MTRAFLIMALLVGGVFASGGDTLRWPVDLRNVQDGDTFFVSRHIAPLRDSTQSVINGRLGNVNIATNANIGQDKIDSTGTGWLYRYGKKFIRWSGEFLSFRSARGISVFVNDTTANSQPFSIISDSSDTVAKFSESGVVLKKGLTGTIASFSGNVGADSIAGTKFNSGQGWTEIYLQDQNYRTTDDVVHDSLALTDLRVADDVTIVDRLAVSGITTLDSVVAGDVGADSVGCTKINTGNGWVEAYPMNQDVQSTASPSFVNGTFTGNVTLGDAGTDNHTVNGSVTHSTDQNVTFQSIYDNDFSSATFNRGYIGMLTGSFYITRNAYYNGGWNYNSASVPGAYLALNENGALQYRKASAGTTTYNLLWEIDAANQFRTYSNFYAAAACTLGSSPAYSHLAQGVFEIRGRADIDTVRIDNRTISTTVGDLMISPAGGDLIISGNVSCDSLATGDIGADSVTATHLSVSTVAGEWYNDTTFACTLSRVGYTSTLSYNATYKDSIGTCRIVKTGANYNMYLYGFSAMVSASGFGLMYLKSVLPVAWRPNESYSGMIGDNGGANFATWSYDPSSYRILFSFETSNSMWLTGLNINYTR